MNLRELAKELGLSTTTVSVCLTGDPAKRKIAAATILRVREYAQEKGYVPNRMAKKIFGLDKRETIGILVQLNSSIDRNLPLLPDVFSRITASGQEYMLQSCLPAVIPETVRLMVGNGIRRIVIIGTSNDLCFQGLERIPGLELYCPDYAFERTTVRNKAVRFRGGFSRKSFYRNLVQKIEEAGKGPILMDYNVNASLLHPEKYLFFSVPPARQHADYCQFGYSLTDKVYSLIMEGKCRVVLVHHDKTAAGLMAGLLEKGIRIPEEVEIFGYDDFDFVLYLQIPLTTVRIPVKKHLDMILDHLLDKKELPEEIITEPEVIFRKSFGKIPL